MTFAGPTKNCPRCNALLPAQAPFCSTCGLQLSAPAGPGSAPAGGQGAPGPGSAPYGGQSAPGGWPQSQPTAQAPGQFTPTQFAPAQFPAPAAPGAPPQAAPGWPQSQPGAAPPAQTNYGGGFPPAQPGFGAFSPGQPGPVYAPAAMLAPPKKGISTRLILIVIVVVLIGGGAAAYFILHGGSGSGSGQGGLPSNVPLPSAASFVTTQTITDPKSGASATEWFYTVASPNTPDAVAMFYQTNLPSHGWTQVQSYGDAVIGCQSNEFLEAISAASFPNRVTAPSGGSALEIVLTTGAAVSRSSCG